MSPRNAWKGARRIAGRAKRRLFPTPAMAAWRQACREAERVPRYTPGRIRLMGYDLGYTDLLTTCPQWEDLFVRQTLRFETGNTAPRILDCGANIGLATLYFKRAHPRARITAFEADPSIYRVMVANLRRNGAADVETVQAAVWNKTGEIEFHSEGADSGAIATRAHRESGATRPVPSLRLRDVLDDEPVDLLKLDIEGAEGAVLDDCRGALGNVRALALDLHEFDPAHRQTGEVLDLLAAEGFTYALDELVPLPWRPPVTGANTPFPARALCWAVLVRAWRA